MSSKQHLSVVEATNQHVSSLKCTEPLLGSLWMCPGMSPVHNVNKGNHFSILFQPWHFSILASFLLSILPPQNQFTSAKLYPVPAIYMNFMCPQWNILETLFKIIFDPWIKNDKTNIWNLFCSIFGKAKKKLARPA